MSAEESAQPLLDPEVLDKFREDLDEFEVWSAFVQNFLNALPLRIETLRLALTTGDPVGAMDAVLSLKTASQMVGASRLSVLAHALEVAQREGIRVAKPIRCPAPARSAPSAANQATCPTDVLRP